MQNEHYILKDFYLVAYLVASGFDLQGYRKTKEGLTLFVFPNTEKLQKHVNNYFSPQGYVRAVDYGNAIRNLKGIIHKPNLEESYVKQFREIES
jgi:flagellar basal body rod protein FlgG